MGGCASRPKDLDLTEPVPIEAPASTDNVVGESEVVPQENEGTGEENKEDPSSIDVVNSEESAKKSDHLEQESPKDSNCRTSTDAPLVTL